ncbi:thiamine-monophosphate kinase [Bryobacterales bacterium F-183]|nr:thiamine-monophosphate kinase [Bryobacterales bacterium F-183]
MNEGQIIDWIRKHAGPPTRELVLGIGDDCAIYRPRKGEDQVFTTDFLIEDVHFTREIFPPEAAGHKALARSLSDLAAMGGEPRFCLLSLAMPPMLDPKWLEGFLRGFLKLAKKYGIVLAGGDLSRAPKIVCDVMACGGVPEGKALRRDGARPGDVIYVSGRLGKPWQTHQKPVPRLEFGKLLRGRATAAMDLSDGISMDLNRLCKASGVAASLEKIPLVKGTSLEQALHGGEDYELVFTMPARLKPPKGSLRVGVIEAGDPGLINFEETALEPLGHDHFRADGL